MNLYLLILFVHVASAVALLSGSVIGSPAVRAAIRRARSADAVRTCLEIGRPLLVLEPVAALLVLLSGIYLTSMLHVWTLGWVQVALSTWLVNTVMAVAIVKPAIGQVARAVAAVPGGISERAHTVRWSVRWSVGGDVLLANDAAILVLMVLKPGLGASLLTVAGANALLVARRIATSGYVVPRLADAATLQLHEVPATRPAADVPPAPLDLVHSGPGYGAAGSTPRDPA